MSTGYRIAALEEHLVTIEVVDAWQKLEPRRRELGANPHPDPPLTRTGPRCSRWVPGRSLPREAPVTEDEIRDGLRVVYGSRVTTLGR